MPILPKALALVGRNAPWLAGASGSVLAACRVFVHDRTVLYALLPKLGKKVDAKKLQETIVAESQKAYGTELTSLARQKDLQTQKFLKAKPAARPLIQRDLEYIEGRQREVETKFACSKILPPTRPNPQTRNRNFRLNRSAGIGWTSSMSLSVGVMKNGERAC